MVQAKNEIQTYIFFIFQYVYINPYVYRFNSPIQGTKQSHVRYLR